MQYSFKTLWNATFLFVGPLFAILAWMIRESGQLITLQHEQIFLVVVITGFLLVYLSGFMIEKRHARKRRSAAETDGVKK